MLVGSLDTGSTPVRSTLLQSSNKYEGVQSMKYSIGDEVKIKATVVDFNRLKEIFVKIAPTYNIALEEWNHDIDHVRILFKGQPNTEISKFINAYKSANSQSKRKS